MTSLTVLLLAAFVNLGAWQWHRGEARQTVWAEYQKNAAPINVTQVDEVERFQRISLEGHFEPAQQFLLDNRSHAGQPGYEVLTPFTLTSGERLLVNRGWVPFTGYRDRLPDISLSNDAVRYPSRPSIRASESRIDASSSTINTAQSRSIVSSI